jgi:hypothetical protein
VEKVGIVNPFQQWSTFSKAGRPEGRKLGCGEKMVKLLNCWIVDGRDCESVYN